MFYDKGCDETKCHRKTGRLTDQWYVEETGPETPKLHAGHPPSRHTPRPPSPCPWRFSRPRAKRSPGHGESSDDLPTAMGTAIGGKSRQEIMIHCTYFGSRKENFEIKADKIRVRPISHRPTLTRREVPPQPQLTPIRLCTNCILALGDMTRKSVLVASSAPPPIAGPPMAATDIRGARLAGDKDDYDMALHSAFVTTGGRYALPKSCKGISHQLSHQHALLGGSN